MEAAVQRQRRLCPHCGSSWICRSHRTLFFERHFLHVFRLAPYRCDRCDRRFYLRTTPAAQLTHTISS